MVNDGDGTGVGRPWWQTWAIAAVSAAIVTMAVGLLLGVAAAIVGVDVHWGTVVLVSTLIVAVELPFMVLLAVFGRMALAQLRRGAARNEVAVARWRARRDLPDDS